MTDHEPFQQKLITGNDLVAVAETDTTTKPRLLIDAANPDRMVADLRERLGQSGLYDRGLVARLARDQTTRATIVIQVTVHDLVRHAHTVCRPYRIKQGKTGEDDRFIASDCALPHVVAQTFLDWRGEWRLPPLNGIASAPLLRNDGSIATVTGYDEVTGIWIDEGVPDVTALVPLQPTQEDAEHALRLLRETFQTFCFGDAVTAYLPGVEVPVVDLDHPPRADETGALMAILTAVCRPSLDLAPGFLVAAPKESGAGCGKGLLCRAVAAIAYGCDPHAVTGGDSVTELEKRIGSELMIGRPVLLVDNLNNTALKSDLLASIITERPVSIRILGQSKMATINSTALIVVTGNALSVSEDLARRFITIELDPRTEDPEGRPFQGDILRSVRERRAELLAATLTIWRWGRQHPALATGRPLGSFRRWCHWVRDPLLALGCQDPVTRASVMKSQDPVRLWLAELFRAWQQHHGASPVRANDLHPEVKGLLEQQGTNSRQSIASQLNSLRGSRMAGFVLTAERSAAKWSPTKYLLVCTDELSIGDHRGVPDGLRIGPV